MLLLEEVYSSSQSLVHAFSPSSSREPFPLKSMIDTTKRPTDFYRFFFASTDPSNLALDWPSPSILLWYGDVALLGIVGSTTAGTGKLVCIIEEKKEMCLPGVNADQATDT